MVSKIKIKVPAPKIRKPTAPGQRVHKDKSKYDRKREKRNDYEQD